MPQTECPMVSCMLPECPSGECHYVPPDECCPVCAPREACERRQCDTFDMSAGQCPEKLGCSIYTGMCVERNGRCARGRDCPMDQVCRDFECHDE